MILYRTESYGSEGTVSARDIIAFEIGELCNTDILLTLLEKGLLSDSPAKDRHYSFESDWTALSVKGKAEAAVSEIEDASFIDDLSEEDFLAFADEILASIEEATGIHVTYARWLASKEAIRTHYGKDMSDPYDYDAYETGPIVLSDLGSEGLLYGYEKLPLPIEGGNADPIVFDRGKYEARYCVPAKE